MTWWQEQYGTVGTVVKAKAIKMDKSFDFTSFLDKDFVVSEAPEISETNVIKDEVFKKGLLKTIIMAGNGVFEVVDSKYGMSVKNQGGNYPGLGAAYESLANGIFITENPAPKLPRKAVETVIEWYRRITEKNGEEAQVNFYWNEFGRETVTSSQGVEVPLRNIPGVHFWSDNLFSYTPLQYNSGALTEVADEDPWYDELNRTFGMYVETHSHNSMDAFASGTDEENSTNDGFQLVFGQLNTKHPVMYSWMTMNEVMKLGMSESDLSKIMEFDVPFNETANKLIYDVDALEFDETLFEAWDAQVIDRPVRSYAYGAYSGVRNYGSGTTQRTVVTAASVYARYSSEQELGAVSDAIDEELSNNMIHRLATVQGDMFDYDTVISLIKEAYLGGYEDKLMGAQYVNGNTIARQEQSAANTVADILESLYDYEETE